MRVKSCEASDNRNRPIELSDENGCVLRPKMVSKYMKMRSTDPRATVVTYAFFHAFKFPDSMAVHIRCKVPNWGFRVTIWNKKLPIFKSGSKGSQRSVYLKSGVFKIAQKVTKYIFDTFA